LIRGTASADGAKIKSVNIVAAIAAKTDRFIDFSPDI